MDLDLFEDILISSETASDRISVHSTLLSNSHNSTLTNQPVSEHPQTHSGVLPPASSTPESSVISKIESILESIASCILEEKDELTIHLKTRKPATSKKSNSSKDNSNQLRAVTFPGKKLEEGWKFTVLLRILELSHAALVKGAVITKRFVPSPSNSPPISKTEIPHLQPPKNIANIQINKKNARKGITQ